MSDGIFILVLRDAGCDLRAPHSDEDPGRPSEARVALGRIKAEGGRELHLCQPCYRAIVTDARRSFAVTIEEQ